MAKKYTVVHKKSNVIVNGEPKLPSASTLEYGEIAVNYAVSGETLSIKNAANEVIPFASKPEVERMIDGSGFATSSELASAVTELNQAIVDDEEVIATALNDLNSRIENIYVPSSTSDLYNDSGFITAADTAHTHTAAEVGAMATSERSNYLPTGATLDSVADGATRKLSNYSTTGHTHDQYSTTAHTHSQYSTTAHTHTAAEVGAMATSERGNYLTTATTIPSVEPYFDDVEYDSNTKRINFKHGATVKDYIDATDFIKDGMVDSVAISTPTGGTNSGITCLVVTFNTDAGKDDIEIPLTSIFNPSNFYNKTEADEKFMTISAYTEDEEVIAAALNDLNNRIGDINVPQYTSDLYNDSGFITSADTAHTHTAAEVGAMATSERSNYLTTGATLDSVADGATRKLSNYSTTGHTHTAAEVGAMATSERSNYSTTGHTHTAAEVGAMATSERSNYLPTGTTLDNVADGTTRKLSNYSLTGHTHSEYATTADTANFITSADTANVFLAISGTTTYSEITSARSSGKVLLAKGETGEIYAYQSQTYGVGHVFSFVRTNNNGDISVSRLVCNQSNQWTETSFYVPNESDIASSGFTKNGITGINVNGSAATITNGVADITVQSGGSGLPAVTAADNGKILQVVNGVWTLVTPTTIYTGTDVPLSSVGNDGDIYLQTS